MEVLNHNNLFKMLVLHQYFLSETKDFNLKDWYETNNKGVILTNKPTNKANSLSKYRLKHKGYINNYNFTMCLLNSAILTDSKFTDCIFDTCDLSFISSSRVKFHNCTFKNCELGNSYLRESKFLNCVIDNCSFDSSSRHKANFIKADLSTSTITNTDFTGVNLYKAKLPTEYINSIAGEQKEWIISETKR